MWGIVCKIEFQGRGERRTEQNFNLSLDRGTKPLSSPLLLNAAVAGLDEMLTRACGKRFTVPCISQINSTVLEGMQIKWLKDSLLEAIGPSFMLEETDLVA